MRTALLVSATLVATGMLLGGCGVIVEQQAPPPEELRHIGHVEVEGTAPVGEHREGCRMHAVVDAFERENGAVKLVMHLTTHNHAHLSGCTGEVKISLLHHHEVFNSFYVVCEHNPPVELGYDENAREVERVEWLGPDVHVHALGFAFTNREREGDPVDLGEEREFPIHTDQQ